MEYCNHDFVDTDLAEVQQVNQVGAYSQGTFKDDNFAYNPSYPQSPKPYNNFAPRNNGGGHSSYQGRAQRYQEKPYGSVSYGGYKSTTYGAPPESPT